MRDVDNLKVDLPEQVQPEGYLVRYVNGMTAFVFSDPIHWPIQIIQQVMCIHKMPKPPSSHLQPFGILQ